MDLTASIDTSQLMREMPRILAFGRRTLQEQSVTSVTFICLRAQQLMSAVSISLMDSELQVEVTARTKGGRPSRAKNPYSRSVAVRSDATAPLAVLIVMARGNPNSKYSRSTGNRWPLQLPEAGPGYRARLGIFVKIAVSRMTLARHSSSAFIKTGWTPAIRLGLASPLYRYNPSFGTRRAAGAIPNRTNTLDPAPLGSLTIDIYGDDCTVTATNAVGEAGSTPELRESYQRARDLYGRPAAQQAIDEESSGIAAEVDRRLAIGMKVKFPLLLN